MVSTIALACVAMACAASLPNAGLLDEEQVGDTPAYERYGRAILGGDVPYRDFYVEYPPAALPVFALPAMGADDGYGTRFKLLMLALGVALAATVATTVAATGASKLAVAGAVGLVAVTPAALGPVVLANYDLWPALLATAGLAALVFGRSATAGALLGVGFAAKVFPILLLPVAYLHLRAEHGARAARRCVLSFAAAAAALILPFVALAPGAVGFDVVVAVRRSLQVESLGSSLLLAAHRLGLYAPTVNSEYGSQNLGGDLARGIASAGSVVAAAAVAAVVLVYRRRAGDTTALLFASAAAVTAALAFAKVLSPQYLVWIVPLVALTSSAAACALVLVALFLTQGWFPARYGDVVAGSDIAWVVLSRNLLLVVLAGVLLRALLRRPAR